MTSEIQSLSARINERLATINYGHAPESLYEPIRYIMSLGGKRLRPILVLLSYQLFRDDIEEVVDQSLAVEVFHNFTLMHDDIMDEAPLRRGKATVHEKWNGNTAILSGDVMLVKAYEMLLDAKGDMKAIFQAFNACAAGVCEGQQFDMDFEQTAEVSEKRYLQMIQLKTAVLLGFSLQLGAMMAEKDKNISDALYAMGVDLGIGFQLKDDLLDVYGDQEKFGKQVGGDILANKKTFLLLKALELASDQQRKELNLWLSQTDADPKAKVAAVTKLYDQLNIKALTLSKMNEYFDKGLLALQEIAVEEKRKNTLKDFIHYLIQREQ